MTISALQQARAQYQPKLPKSLKGAVRITSYNVCYTKLLRFRRKPHSRCLSSSISKLGSP